MLVLRVFLPHTGLSLLHSTMTSSQPPFVKPCGMFAGNEPWLKKSKPWKTMANGPLSNYPEERSRQVVNGPSRSNAILIGALKVLRPNSWLNASGRPRLSWDLCSCGRIGHCSESPHSGRYLWLGIAPIRCAKCILAWWSRGASIYVSPAWIQVIPNPICQASRNWQATFTSALVSYGFIQSSADHSLFVLSRNNSFFALLIYVDDIILASNNPAATRTLKHWSWSWHWSCPYHSGTFSFSSKNMHRTSYLSLACSDANHLPFLWNNDIVSAMILVPPSLSRSDIVTSWVGLSI